LLFFGAVNYHPNSDGINHFIDNVFPKILEQRPNTKLWVVGPAPKEMLARRNQNIEVTGFVDEVEPYLDRAAVVVVPLRIGGGTRLKIVEAMAKAKAIVSTRIGAEGIDVEHEKHALLADSDEDFAAQTLRLLDDHALARSLGEQARVLAERSYAWPSLAGRLETFYAELLANPARSSMS
jgi:glycosyltransferase involved in cell wall biosynthesis